MVYYEDIVEGLVRFHGVDSLKHFQIIPVGPSFLVGRSMLDAIEIHGWEDMDRLETL